jgi:hypothetical protein
VNRKEHARELLARLLGPGRPELTCEQCFEELDRYVEFEVAGAKADSEIPGMHAHLEGCPACAEDYESLKDLITASGPPADTA